MSAELRAALDEATAQERAARLARIGGAAPPGAEGTTTELLVRALGDEDPSVRKEAVRLAERWRGAPVVAAALERALRDEDSLSRRSSAMDAFGLLGAHGVPTLVRLLAEAKPGLRRIAVDALGGTKSQEAVPGLLRAAKDEVPSIRAAALEALVRIGAPEAPRALADVIGSPSEPPSVVLAALLGIVGLGDAVAPALLQRHLDDALTAPAALRLLGRAGEATPLVAALASSSGSRQRAAVLGLMEALERSPSKASALSAIGAAELQAALDRHVDVGDVGVVGAALFVGAHAGLVEPFARAAARRDRALLASSLHKAAAVLAEKAPGAADELERRAAGAGDAAGNDLLAELAEAIRRRRGAKQPATTTTTTTTATRASTAAAKLGNVDLLRLAQLLERCAGLSITMDARERIESRLAPRVEASGATTFDAYVKLLEDESARGGGRELAKALELVTVHETYFFRERSQLDAFRDEVLPALVRRREAAAARGAERVVRVWSAGCSSGEEAWTLAIMLRQSGRFGGAVDFEIVGTDISETSVSQARAARYGPKSFRGDIDPDVRKRCFVYELGGVAVHPSLRAQVRFETTNLLDQDGVARLGRFDAVFCRNVLIYMSKEARAKIVTSFFERLVPGGALFLGHSESLLHVDTPFRLLPLARELCWVRPEPGAADAPAATATARAAALARARGAP